MLHENNLLYYYIFRSKTVFIIQNHNVNLVRCTVFNQQIIFNYKKKNILLETIGL